MKKILFVLVLFIGTTVFANKLSNETSPYLLQHKDNPVNWYPWSDKAFEIAKKENKLIFLSIGYSTCHWCHVMAHESFEDDEVAKVLNKDFISIKVDKEQFSHVDNFYQNVFRTMNNKSGGWPLTVVMTADKEPFFAGTYIPKNAGYGSKGLMNIIDEIINAPRKDLVLNGQEILNTIKQNEKLPAKNIKPDIHIENNAIKQFKSYYDFEYKGFAKEPKFPNFANIIMLLKLYEITQNQDAKSMALDTLNAMANGGIYDQIEGAFYRYTVDKKWQLPHFEKMLYTNAEALEAYTLAYKLTKNQLYKKVVDETSAQIDKRFMIENVYYSASNADSKNHEGDNEEGFYFMVDYFEAEEFLEKNNIDEKTIQKTLAYLGIEKDGNFDGDLSNPHITNGVKTNGLKVVKNLLLKMREIKEYPLIDNKINTAWNALYLKGKLKAGYINEQYINEAKKSLDKLLQLMYKDGILYHQTILGKEPVQKGLLEDYSFMAMALFEAYQATLDMKYFKLFKKLTLDSVKLFYKDDRWLESNDGFEVFASINDGGYASALGVNIINLINLATLDANMKLLDIAKKTLNQFGGKINKYPSYYPNTTLASIMGQVEPVFVKSKLENLKSYNSASISYPFVYKYEYDASQYLACKINSCFSYSDKFDVVKKAIEDLIKTSK
jgi:uncharacterized protein YyaL (SSP411 family)